MRTELLGSSFLKNTMLVFLHGWACCPGDFRFQIELFKNQYPILLVDYSAFIEKQTSINIDLFSLSVSAIQQEIFQHAKRRVVLIGHSMGGVMALALSRALKDRVAGCVLMDCSISGPSEAAGKYDALIQVMPEPEGEAALAELIQTRMINEKTDNRSLMQEKKREILSRCRKASKAFGKLLADACHYDTPTALSACVCPLLYIASDPGFADREKLIQLNHQVRIKKVSSGHFVMLNQRDRVNRLLSNFLLSC